MNEVHDSITLDHVRRVLRRRWWVVAPMIVVGAVAGALLALASSERYEATATVLVGSTGAQGPGSSAPLTAAAIARLVRTRAVAERVGRELTDGRTPAELLQSVSAQADGTGTYIDVTAGDDEAAGAARLANAFAGQLAAVQEEAPAEFEAVIEATRDRLARLPVTSPAYDSLRSELVDLRTTSILGGVDAQVIDTVISPVGRGEGAPLPWALSGTGLGLLLGLVVAFALEALDPRVRALRQLGRLSVAPQLAAMPRPGTRLRHDKTPSILAARRQPLEHLRGALLALYGERRIGRIIVTSPHSSKEGKTAVAAGLAVSLARIGMHVCVIDADLRRPALASHFGLGDAAVGLADVLRGAPLAQAAQPFTLEQEARVGVGELREPVQLDVVAAGSGGTDCADLLAGERMREVVQELGLRYDVVILDCAPILEVGDGLPLLEQASGTILVVRHSYTARRAVSRAERVVAEARGTLLGIVATGVPREELAAEGHGPWPSSACTAPAPDL